MTEPLTRRALVPARRARLLTPPDEPAAGAIGDRLQTLFRGLARHLQEAERVRVENEELRAENRVLRESLAACVSTCEPLLSPEYDDAVGTDEYSRACTALTRARTVLATWRAPRLPG